MFRRRLEAGAAPELLSDAICAGSLFRQFASLHGIEKDIQIVALSRSGSYACELLVKPDRGQARRDIVLRARQFGILENELEGLAIRAEKRSASFRVRSGAWSYVAK